MNSCNFQGFASGAETILAWVSFHCWYNWLTSSLLLRLNRINTGPELP